MNNNINSKIKNLCLHIENFLKDQNYKLKGTKTGIPRLDKLHENGMKFFEKHPIIPKMSVYSLVKLMAMKTPNKYAFDCEGTKVTYKQLIKNADSIAKAFKKLGVKKGDIVTITMPNLEQGLELFLAANKLGAGVTFLNSYAPKEEIKEYIDEFKSNLFINYDTEQNLNTWILDHTHAKNIVTITKDEAKRTIHEPKEDNHKHIKRYMNYTDLFHIAKKSNDFIKPSFDSKATSLILFTSGTTGKPKPVVLTNENVIAAEIYAKNTSHTEKTIKGEKTLVCVPYAYPYGFVTSAVTSMLMGKEGILAPNIGKNTISDYLKKKPNVIFGSPALLKLIINNVPENQDLSFVTHFISGGDFLTPKLYEEAKEFFKKHGAENVQIGDGFGNAETVSIGSTPIGVKEKPDTAGKILAGLKFMIVDPDDVTKEKKYGEEGMLCISGKLVFEGYYNRDELTKEAKFIGPDGHEYFKTGTMGIVDEEGYFKVTGRKSRFYITEDLQKVYLDRVQNIIQNYPWIKECAAVKVEEDSSVVNKLFVVLNPEYKNKIDEQKIRLGINIPVKNEKGEQVYLREFEKPTYIEIVDELPLRAGTEKVDYSSLGKRAQNNPGKILAKK